MSTDPSFSITIAFIGAGIALIIFSLTFLPTLRNWRINIIEHYKKGALEHFNEQMKKGKKVENILFNKPIELYWDRRNDVSKIVTNSLMYFLISGFMLIIGGITILINDFCNILESYYMPIVILICIITCVFFLFGAIKYSCSVYKEESKISQ